MKGFSIIVCCYNSEELLPDTLKNIALLERPMGCDIELIVIDNACTDRTTDVADEVWRGAGAPFRMIIGREDIAGLSYARKRGMSLAQYDFLVFCDDDNRLDVDYLVCAHKILLSNSVIGALGGLGRLDTVQIPAFWPKDFYIFGMGPQAAHNGKTNHIHGAGIIIRKEAFDVLDKVGFSFILSDRKGKKLTSGGDYELCYAIAFTGFEIWYHDSLKFSHFIRPERMSWSYCKRFIEESVSALDILNVYQYVLIHVPNGKAGLLRLYLHLLKTFLYHGRCWIVSSWLRWKYEDEETLRFLEKFHQKFHWERLKSICAYAFRERLVYSEIRSLKKRIMMEQETKSL